MSRDQQSMPQVAVNLAFARQQTSDRRDKVRRHRLGTRNNNHADNASSDTVSTMDIIDNNHNI